MAWLFLFDWFGSGLLGQTANELAFLVRYGFGLNYLKYAILYELNILCLLVGDILKEKKYHNIKLIKRMLTNKKTQDSNHLESKLLSAINLLRKEIFI